MTKPSATWLIVVIVLAAAVLALLLAPSRSRAPASAAPVAATIFPIYDIARNVAKDIFAVTLVLPPGAEPHSFEPAPSTVRALAEAEVVYAVGYGLDDWIDGIVPPTTEKRVLDDGITLRPSVESFRDQGAEEAEDVGPTDPHYWLSVPNAKRMAATMAADLKARFPDHADRIDANLIAYQAELDAADAEVRAALASLENRRIITFHDAWYYFAEEYGLTLVGTFEPAPGREPTPRYLQELRSAVEKAGATTLYTEPLFSSDAISAFAADHGLRLAEIDDVGGTPGRDSYVSLMRANAKTIQENQR
jgi:ABC-type Zn uptake system ZnuABC Zn-binding protein ZnuA